MSRPLYDAFELNRMGEYSDHHGETFCEPIMNYNTAEDDEECLRRFWTVFGHYTPPKCGRDAIKDFDTLEEAGEFFDFLCTLLDSHKKTT